MKKTTLVIMAAGMGSRYGGLKQLDPIVPSGEIILDFSVYDAVKAGFDKVIFITRKDIEKEFRSIIGKRVENMIDTDYVIQDLSNLPDGVSVPGGREKPWGTGHAVYCVKDKIDAPFALINADDYYGKEAYKLICDHLKNENKMCMVGYRLGNTLTENGTVSRGICEIENGYLRSITEECNLDKNCGIPLDTTVSMNMWGLTPDVFGYVENDFKTFLANMQNPLKDEFYIPTVINNMIHNRGFDIKVLQSGDKWYGVTYREDKKFIGDALTEKMEKGYYDGI